MKTKLIVLCLLLSSFCFAEDYSRFEVRINGILTHYAYIKVVAPLMGELIPQEAKDRVYGKRYDAEGNVIPHPVRTLQQFAMTSTLADDGGYLVRLAAKDLGECRRNVVTVEDLDYWLIYLLPHNYPVNLWMTREEYKAALPEPIE